MQLSVFFINNLVYILWRSVADYITIVVTIAWRIHLFSFRTQKLSFSAPKVLVGWLTGRIGRCHIIFLDSSAAEHPAVNRRVVGSNPTRGAIYVDRNYWFGQKRVKNACFWLFFICFWAFLRPFLRLKYVSWPCHFHCWFLAFFWKIKVWTYNIPILAIF